MDLGLTGRTALVPGAGGGLGNVIATTLAVEGPVVVAADLDEAAASRTAVAVISAGGGALPLAWDLGRLEAVDVQVGHIEHEFGPVDILIAITAGPPPGPMADQPAEVRRRHSEATVISVIAIADCVLPGMRQLG